MLGNLDFAAIITGIFTGFGLSFLVGFILAMAMLSDDKSPPDEEQMARQFAETSVALQIVVLSLVTSALAGAFTAWMSNTLPLVNAGVVGAIMAILGQVVTPPKGFPNQLRLLSAIATLPATLLGAWIIA